MAVRVRVAHVLGFLAVLAGVLLLAFTQESAVLPDEGQAGLSQLQGGNVIGEVTGVVGSALLVTLGAVLVLARASPAPLLPRAAALAIVGLALPLFLVVQTLLVINGIAAQFGTNRVVFFSASYFFHTGHEFSFAAVYVLFFFTLLLVFLLLGAIGYLLAPRRFGAALFERMNWVKNEAVHVASTLFLLLNLGVLFVYLLRLATETDPADLRGRGLLAESLLPLYFLLCLLLLALALTVAAHAFLLNWGSQAPMQFTQLVENIRTIGRVERALLVAAAALNGLILLAPTLPSRLELSESFAFDLSPRGFAYVFYLLLVPYLPYRFTQRRLDFLLRAGRAASPAQPFTERSLRLVLIHVLGLVLITAIAVPARWDPLGHMLALSAWTGGVLLSHAVRVERGAGLPRLGFDGEAGPPLYFVFLGLALTTGLMLWGSGNTFEVSYLPVVDSLEFVNESSYGADVFARVAAAAVIAGSLVLTLDLWLQAYRVPRRFLGHYLALFLTTTLVTLLAFTVGVWTEGGNRGLRDAYAGFAFRQYSAGEEVGVAVLLTLTVAYVFVALLTILGPILERARGPAPARALRVR